MAEINDLLSNISNIKTDIKSAIENKGQNVTNFASYPNAIQNIVSGGSNGIKIYDSIANMQNSSNSSTGDLAIVYNSTIDNITENTQFQEGTFPETVTLTTAISDYIELQFKAVDESIMFDCWGNIDSQRFMLDCYADDGSGDWSEYRIEYTSSDGLTYTRTRFQKNQEDISGNVMDFDTVIMFGSRWGEPTWDDIIGDFVKAGTTSFEGMYKYNGINYNWANTGLNTLSDDVYKGKFYGNNIITNGTGNIVTNLNINQLKDKINLYNDLSYLYLSNNTQDLSYLFQGGHNLTNIPNINTINVTNMYYMLGSCENLTNIPNFDTSNVINMNHMFTSCYNLTNIPNLNTINVTDMDSIFLGCNHLTNIPNFDTSNVIYMSSAFVSCENLFEVSNLNLINASYIRSMFQGCYNLTSISNLTTSNAIDVSGIFWGCRNLVNISNFNTSKALYINGLFYECQNLINVPNLDTSNAIQANSMFQGCYNITTIPNFNLLKVNNAYQMFAMCNKLTLVPDLDISNARVLTSMFWNCQNLVEAPSLNTNNAQYMDSLFGNCINLVNVPLLNMTLAYRCSGMFSNCNNLSDASYANIVNMLPNASQLTNQYISNIGLNVNKFTEEQKNILSNKGYFEFLPNWYTVIYS